MNWFKLVAVQTVGAFEAKTHLSALLGRVAKGESFTLTRHGVPIARLVPLEPSSKPERAAIILALETFGKGRTLKGTTIRQLIEEGRRY